MSEKLKSIREQIPQDKSVTLVGGAFDLLHPGHLHVIDFAKKLGDKLVVSVLSDEHIKSYKGSERPVLPEGHRLAMVEALRSVDHAFISDSSSYSPENLATLRPDNLVFGIENDEERIKKVDAQKRAIREQFPSIQIHDLERFSDESVSTSAIINKIKSS